MNDIEEDKAGEDKETGAGMNMARRGRNNVIIEKDGGVLAGMQVLGLNGRRGGSVICEVFVQGSFYPQNVMSTRAFSLSDIAKFLFERETLKMVRRYRKMRATNSTSKNRTRFAMLPRVMAWELAEDMLCCVTASGVI